jgi:hypothetical protein
MAQPIWITPAGSLGTIPENIFFKIPLIARDPDGDPVYYKLISGTLPTGIQIDLTGFIIGIPEQVVNVQGVPSDVAQDITNRFAIRAYNTRSINGVTVINRLADRTFSLTVTGQDAPTFTTPSGLIGRYFDSTSITDLQIDYTHQDSNEPVVMSIAEGSLPPDLTMSPSGLITGVLSSTAINPSNSVYRYFAQYNFVAEITDGKESDLRAYAIQIYDRAGLRADTSDSIGFTADNTFITADATPEKSPVMITPTGSIGSVRSDNYYAFKFEAISPNGTPVRFNINIGADSGFDTVGFDTSGFDKGTYSLPNGLQLDPLTGWLYGYIPDLGETELSYTFGVQLASVTDPLNTSPLYLFTLLVKGSLDTEVTWLTPSNLGSINTGSISMFDIEATNRAGIPLFYRLESGSNSRLPQGLELLESGYIVGRASFNTFSLDNNTTIFDAGTTTVDQQGTFVVEAHSLDETIKVSKQFTITVNHAFTEPYENLYIKAMPPLTSRTIISDLLDNTNIIPTDFLYRPEDTYFGKATDVVYNHAYGLDSDTYDQYIDSLFKNHYWKNLTLGEIETARALDSDGNVVYEVVYSRVIDNLVNSSGQSVGKEIPIPYAIDPGTLEEIDVVYPNSLFNMRNQVIDVVGQVSNILPLWMTSKQSNGQILGFTPAWVICYTKPGKSKQIAYNVATEFGKTLNNIDFEVDRYELDRLLSVNWDPQIDLWTPSPAETTFDRFGRSFNLRFIGEVDYATSLPFVEINGRTVEYINSIGGLDGFAGNLIGKKIVFAKQEGYIEPPTSYFPGPMSTTDAWKYYPEPWSTTGFSAPTRLFDEATVIPGQLESAANPLLQNQRMAVWVISIDSKNLVRLSLLTETVANDYVQVKNGQTYRAVQLYRPATPAAGLLFVNWQPLPTAIVQQTTFDVNSLKFIAPVDMYTTGDEYDRYLVFPKRYIIEPGGSTKPPVPTPSIVRWDNNNGLKVTWNNNSDNSINWTND